MHWSVWHWESLYLSLAGEARDLGGGGHGGRNPHGLDTLNNDIKHDFSLTIRQMLANDYDDNDVNDMDLNPYSNLVLQSHFYDLDSLTANFNHCNKPLFININIQSLLSKYEKLKNLILSITNKGIVIDIIAIQETWSIKYPHLLSIPGFQPLVFANRSKGRGGGVGFYVRNGLNFKVIDSLSPYHDKLFETLTIEITYTSDNRAKHYLATSLYRSPSAIHGMTSNDQIDNFLDNLDRLMTDLNNTNMDSYIFTDSNLNLHNIDNDPAVNNYMTHLTNNGFLLTNFKTTRIQNGCFSLIDHILTNCKLTVISSGTLVEEISDHFVSFLVPNLRKTKTKLPTLKKRLYTQHNLDRFKHDLQQLSWQNVISTNNVDNCYDEFWESYKLLHDQHFPLTSCKFNKNIHKISDFMTTGLLTSRRNKIKFHKIALLSDNIDDWTTYRQFRNLFNKVVRASKKHHYVSELNKNRKNPKKMWDTLKELTVGRTTQITIDKIKVDNITVTDPSKMANEFNKFFTEAGKKIYNSVNPVIKSPLDFVPDTNPPPMRFDNISEVTVISIIDNMEAKTSVDSSGINMKMIKFLRYELAKPLAHLFNLSLNSGIFPSKLKISRTVPIFKSGDNTCCDNYRPISLLSSISKILEKIVANNLTSHLEVNNLIYENQYGFLRNKSTVHNITMLTNKIAKELNERKFVIGVFLDLRKAFDVVSHEILLKKLSKLGIKDTELKWFTSYLKNRQQFTDIGGNHSSNKPIDISVLQGSILGPILFLCFINDLHLATDLFTLLFADDTSGLDSDKDLPTLITRVNGEIKKLANWFRANRMAVNVNKTKYIIFRPKGTKIDIDLDTHGVVYNSNEIGMPDDPNNIFKLGRIYNDNPDNSERSYKFLGIYLDEYLSYDTHCNTICKKLAMSNFMLNRAKNFLTPHTLRTLYFSLIHPHLLYGLPIYSCTTQKNISKIFKLQKKAIRIITKSKYNANTSPLFQSLKILPLKHLISYTKGLLIHSIYHKYSPPALHNTWTTNEHRGGDHDLRNASDLYVPMARTEHVKRLTYFSLPAIWNNLPDDKLNPNQTTFRIAYKYYLHELANNDAESDL